MKCPFCGNEIPDQAKYCPFCAGRIRRKAEKNLIIGCAAAGVGVFMAILIGLFVFSKGSKAKDALEESQTVETVAMEDQQSQTKVQKEEKTENQQDELDTYRTTADDYERWMEPLDMGEEDREKYQGLVAKLRRVQKEGDLSETKKTAEELKTLYETCAEETIRMMSTGLDEVEMYMYPDFQEAEKKQFDEYEEIAWDYESKKDYPNAILAYQRCLDYQREISEKQSQSEPVMDVSVEEEVKRIRSIYNEITAAKDAKQYSVSREEKGVTLYSDQTGIRCVEIVRGYAGSPYARYYYYENQKLIFAYLEAKDSHRLYFKDEHLFRWRYASDAAKASAAVNHDQEDSPEFRSWERFALQEADAYVDGTQIQKTDDTEMLKAYQEIIQKYETESAADEAYEWKQSQILDLNGDGIQELCIERSWNGHGETLVWIWENNHAAEVTVPSVGTDQERQGIYFVSDNLGHSSGTARGCYRLNVQNQFEYVFGWSWTNGAYNGLGRDAYFEDDENGNHVKEISEAYIDEREAALGIAD